MTHRLKCVSPLFSDLVVGTKTFELRKNDRGYAVGDELVLCEVDDTGDETGRSLRRHVQYILDAEAWRRALPDEPPGLGEGYCILGLWP